MGLSIIVAIAAFLVVTLILVALLLYAKAKLMPSGEVRIDINEGEKVLTVSPGSTLLSTLGNNGRPAEAADRAGCASVRC